MDQFQIELDSPNGVFYPGQQVCGKVHLKLREPMKARAVIIQIEGKACTAWTVRESRNRSSTSASANNRSTESVSVPYKSEVKYMDVTVKLWQSADKDQQKIPFGLHTFPFSFILPLECPPSFEGTIGFIRYSCKAKIDRPWKIDDHTKTVFTVIPQFDLNTIQYAAQPVVKDISKNIGVLMFKHGRISARIFLPKSGYVPGEKVPLRLEISNGSSKDVIKVKCKLLEVVHYTAERHGHHFHNRFPHANVLKRDECRIILKLEDDYNVFANSSGEWTRELQVPALVPSFNICPIIQVDYRLKLKIVTNGSFGNTIEGDVPLLIGTIPVRQFQNYPIVDHLQNYEFLAPPQPTAPDISDAYGLLPTYEDSIFGHGTLYDEEGNDGNNSMKFTPRYAFYKDL